MYICELKIAWFVMSEKHFSLPNRQKKLIGGMIVVGLVILFAYLFRLFDVQVLASAVFFYSFIVPGWILVDESLIDLDDNRIYFVWLIIGIILFMIYLLARDIPEFEIKRSEIAKGINRYITNNTLSGLKSLLIFLLSYKVLNSIMKSITGDCLVNTYRQMSWKHDTEERPITSLDVTFNIILMVVIVVSVLTR